jgi:hypothetical protein
MIQAFTPANPPTAGDARRLWDWYCRQSGHAPDRLVVNRPGIHQREAGMSHYIIARQHTDYLIWSVEKTLQMSLSDARRDSRTGDMILV